MTRRQAREIAIQSLYQMEMNDVSSHTAIETVIENRDDDQAEDAVEIIPTMAPFITKLVEGVWDQRKEIDQLISGYVTGWSMDRLSRVDLQVLRLATFEMVIDQQSPPKVAVNEAVDLAKYFGTEESGKFVNGVLGKMINDIPKIKDTLLKMNHEG